MREEDFTEERLDEDSNLDSEAEVDDSDDDIDDIDEEDDSEEYDDDDYDDDDYEKDELDDSDKTEEETENVKTTINKPTKKKITTSKRSVGTKKPAKKKKKNGNATSLKASAKGKNSTANVPAQDKPRCLECGCGTQEEFYISSSSLYGHYKKIPWCKDCLNKHYEEMVADLNGDERRAVKNMCLKFNIPYEEHKVLAGALTSQRTAIDYNSANPDTKRKQSENLWKLYMRLLNSYGLNGTWASYTPVEFDFVDVMSKLEKIEKSEEKMRPEEYVKKIQLENNVLTDEELMVKQEVIEQLEGRDPFLGTSNFDQKYLYGSLSSLLTEEILGDVTTLNAAIQMVTNNNQIRNIDIIINAYMRDVKTMLASNEKIKALQDMKNKISSMNKDIGKENGISLKSRVDKSVGKSSLGGMMQTLREMDFEDAEADYYDEKKAFGMKMAANISAESWFAQIQPDENDYLTMLKEAKEKRDELEAKIDELLEQNRLLHKRLGE